MYPLLTKFKERQTNVDFRNLLIPFYVPKDKQMLTLGTYKGINKCCIHDYFEL